MNGSQLRSRVRIQRRVAGRDAFNQPAETWIDVATVSARIRPLTGRELLLAKGVQALSTHEVEMRYRADVDPTMRLVHQARIFAIDNVADVGMRHVALLMQCTEGANQG